MTRLIAVGDIHGQFDMLVALMSAVSPSENDQFVFLGDYVDRGAKTPEVLDWLIDFLKRYPEAIFLRGNHEQMLLDAFEAAEKKNSRWNILFDDFLALSDKGLPGAVIYYVSCGGQETLSTYAGDTAQEDPCAVLLTIPKRHRDFLLSTRLFFEKSGFLFVHAGVDPKDVTGEKRGDQAFLWERRPLWKLSKGWNKVVVHGHTPVPAPYFDRLEINLDTGAGYGAQLTACDVLTKEIWQAPFV